MKVRASEGSISSYPDPHLLHINSDSCHQLGKSSHDVPSKHAREKELLPCPAYLFISQTLYPNRQVATGQNPDRQSDRQRYLLRSRHLDDGIEEPV
jgi:hypothetical protein